MRHIAFIMVICTVVLAACDSAASDDPAQAVENYLSAKVESDRETVQSLLCSELERNLEREVRSFQNVDARIEDMACERNEDTDTVTCAGAIVYVYEDRDEPIDLATYRVVEEDDQWKWCGETEPPNP